MAEEVNIADRTITVPSIVSHFSDEDLNSGYHAKADYENAINKYGVIYKIVSFSETSDLDQLKDYTRRWIKQNYYDGVLSFTIKAVDLHLLGYLSDKIFVGDRISVEFIDDYSGVPIFRTMTCLSAQYDLMKPENSTYKIGIPDVSTNTKYRESINAKSTTRTGNNYRKLQSPVGLGNLLSERFHDGLVDYGLIPPEAEEVPV